MFSCFNSDVQSSNKSFISLLCPLCDRAPGIYAGHKPCLRLRKAEHYPAVGQPPSELQSQILLNHTL